MGFHVYIPNVLARKFRVKKMGDCDNGIFVLYSVLWRWTVAEITPGRIGEFLRIVFDLLWNKPEGLPATEILAQIPKSTPLSEYENGFFPSAPNAPRYEKIIRLATIPLVKAGWLVKNKGRWYITEEGRQACKSFTAAEEFYAQATRLYREYYEWRGGRPAISLTVEEAEEKAWEQIQKYLQEMKPFEFLSCVADLLRAMNYHVAWSAPPGKERGYVDMIVYTDRLGVSVPRIIVQVKHRGQAATAEGLRAFLAVLGLHDFGLFVSSGGFTMDAKEIARLQERHKVTLMDMENFFDLWVEHYEQLSQEARQRLPLKPIHFLSPGE
jgi:restriction system protein